MNEQPVASPLTRKTTLHVLRHIESDEFVCLQGTSVPGSDQQAVVAFLDRESADLWRSEIGMREFCDILPMTPEEIEVHFPVLWWADDPEAGGFFFTTQLE